MLTDHELRKCREIAQRLDAGDLDVLNAAAALPNSSDALHCRAASAQNSGGCQSARGKGDRVWRHAYKDRVATCGDTRVVKDFYRVLSLTAPPRILLRPKTVARALILRKRAHTQH
jgi:hypothetical protein